MRGLALGLGVMLLTAGCGTTMSAAEGRDGGLGGTAWGIERIDDVTADSAATTLRFDGQHRVWGRTGCNQYSAPLTLTSDTLRIGNALSTRMACEPPVMAQERRFLTALGAVRAYRREGDRLLLLDEAGRVRLRLTPLP